MIPNRPIWFQLALVGLLLLGCQKSPVPGTPQGIRVSSGGELIEDRQNPWWVRNTKTVRYCLTVDESSFSLSRTELGEMIRRALAYWRGEFTQTIHGVENADEFDRAFHFLGVGTQEFTAVECGTGEDLRFQFGYGTLSDAELSFLREPEHYIAASTRTEYNEVQLKGKGFVYLSSDIGVHRYGGANGIPERAWRNRASLYLVLLHELGHVFGVPHIGEVTGLMSARFPEIVLKLASAFQSAAKEYVDPEPFFVPRFAKDSCYLVGDGPSEAPEGRRFFELPNEVNCLYFTMSYDGKGIEVGYPKTLAPRRIALGEIHSLTQVATPHTAVAFRFPDRQTVFHLGSRLIREPSVRRIREWSLCSHSRRDRDLP